MYFSSERGEIHGSDGYRKLVQGARERREKLYKIEFASLLSMLSVRSTVVQAGEPEL